MARLNGKRRRAAAQRRLATDFAKALNPSTVAMKGQVRSSNKASVANQIVPAVARAFAPNPFIGEGRGKLGKVVKGQFVPKHPAKRKRFGVKS